MHCCFVVFFNSLQTREIKQTNKPQNYYSSFTKSGIESLWLIQRNPSHLFAPWIKQRWCLMSFSIDIFCVCTSASQSAACPAPFFLHSESWLEGLSIDPAACLMTTIKQWHSHVNSQPLHKGSLPNCGKSRSSYKALKMYIISQWLGKMAWLGVFLRWKQFKTMSVFSKITL